MTRKTALALVLMAFMASLLFCSENSKQNQDDNQGTKADDIDTLFKKASNAESAGEITKALGFYEQIAKEFPNSDKRDKALFMAGYLNYENLSNKDDAVKYFDELLKKYPNSDLADDAEFMLKAINSGKDALSTFEEENK